MDALFGEPRLAAIYDLVEGERRGDLDHYLAIAAELGARSLLDVGLHPALLVAGRDRGLDPLGRLRARRRARRAGPPRPGVGLHRA
jgi:hypothetical protein